jgi:hypothetical protein
MSGPEETVPDIDERDNKNPRPIEREQEKVDEGEKKPNPLRCPFAPRTESMKQNLSRHTKRTQRYRSTAQSRLGDMTVGDIRYCFQQLRNAGDSLTSEMILYNGQCAGEFALQYLQETSSATKKRRKNVHEDGGRSSDVEPGNSFTRMEFPSSQITAEEVRDKKQKTNVLEF